MLLAELLPGTELVRTALGKWYNSKLNYSNHRISR